MKDITEKTEVALSAEQMTRHREYFDAQVADHERIEELRQEALTLQASIEERRDQYFQGLVTELGVDPEKVAVSVDATNPEAMKVSLQPLTEEFLSEQQKAMVTAQLAAQFGVSVEEIQAVSQEEIEEFDEKARLARENCTCPSCTARREAERRAEESAAERENRVPKDAIIH